MSSLRHSLFHGSEPLPSPGAQAQHLLRKYCLGLPDTSWGTRLSTSRSWTGDTVVMVLEGQVVSPGRGWLGLPRPCCEEKRGKQALGWLLGWPFVCFSQAEPAGPNHLLHLLALPTTGAGPVPRFAVLSSSHGT